MVGKVYFIGAGPGDPELLTLRGRRLIGEADLVLYADSLVSPEILQFARPEAEVVATAELTLETIVERMLAACRAGQTVARLASGDPSIYGDPARATNLAKARADTARSITAAEERWLSLSADHERAVAEAD